MKKYKGYIIKKETDPWAWKLKWRFRFYRDERILHAKTIEEAKEEIDERTAN